MRYLAATLAAVAVLAAGCSSSKKTTATTSAGRVATPPITTVATTPSTPATTAPSTSASSLAGTWSGHYSGAYSGTFTLTWQQSGSTLSGTIKLSSSAAMVPINGSVSGGTIRFGTVGSTAITYSGTVSGHSMSGTYQVAGTSGGPWSATKM